MADARRMAAEFDQGTVDRTYIQLAPDRGGVVEYDWPLARANFWEWPNYINAGLRGPGPFDQSRLHHLSTRIQEPLSTKPVHNRWPI
jgi:hypothetical protein